MLADGGGVGKRLTDAVHRADHGRAWPAHLLVPTAAAFHHAHDVQELPERAPELVEHHRSFAYAATALTAGSCLPQTTTKSECRRDARTLEVWWNETIRSDSARDRGSDAGHENLDPLR